MRKDSQTGLFTGQGYFFSLVFFIVMQIMPGDLLLLENCDIIIKIYYNSQYMMISGAKGQKAVHACMIRLLNLGPAEHEEVAIYVVNQRIPNVRELRELLCSGAIRGYQVRGKRPFALTSYYIRRSSSFGQACS